MSTASDSVFLKDKRAFFEKKPSCQAIVQLAQDKQYRFLKEQQDVLEQEFAHLLEGLYKEKENKDIEIYWLYCYYCSELLKNYYTAYGNQDKVNQYTSQCEALLYRCQNGKFKEKVVQTPLPMGDQFLADLNAIIRIPTRTSTLKKAVGSSSMLRLQVVFSRLTVKSSLLVLQELQWLEKLDQVLGRPTDIEGMVAVMNAPAGILNVLSVGFFAARLLINSAMILKHTFYPSKKEQDITNWERFVRELSLRQYQLGNDLVWGTVNLLTNFTFVLQLSAPVASWLTSGFLVFDAAWLLVQWVRSLKEYQIKRDQYLQEKQELLTGGVSEKDVKIQLLMHQLQALEVEWTEKSASWLFCVGAAAFLLAGFTATLLLTTPAAIPLFYLVCTLAVAMYFSAGQFAEHQKQSCLLQQCQANNGGVALVTQQQEKQQQARNEFIIAMIKNTVMPLLIVTTFAICWQAALVLTVLYIGYECSKKYREDKPLKPAAPIEELPAAASAAAC